jgi:hypothetical protein
MSVNFWIPEPIFIKLGMYIMTPNPHLNGVSRKSTRPISNTNITAYQIVEVKP